MPQEERMKLRQKYQRFSFIYTMNFWIKAALVSLVLLILTAAGSEIYYYSIYLPQQYTDTINLYMGIRAEERKDLFACLQGVQDNYIKYFSNECATLGLSNSCSLPGQQVSRLEQDRRDEYQLCAYRFPLGETSQTQPFFFRNIPSSTLNNE